VGVPAGGGGGGGPPTTEEAARATRGTLTGLRWLGLIILYAFVILIALQNLGIDVTAMIAGLGIGGIAVALAVQNILGDLFASLTIALDKPFVVGDFIIAGNEMGAVEHVGLKTTRVRSLGGEQLVFSNSDLLSSRVRNYKRMAQRRVVVAFGVEYGTPPDVLAEMRACVEATENVKFDRCHFCAFGDSSLNFETVYYINSPDYNVHMDAQQAILLGVARRFAERGISFAFPTRTLHVASVPRNERAEAITSAAGSNK
jgi:small-conductance mechanosensitive channel